MTLPSWLWKVSLRATPKLTQNCSLVSMLHTACRNLCYNCNPSPPSLPVHLLHCAMVTPVDHALEQLIMSYHHIFFCCSQHRHSLWCLSQPGLTGRLKISAGCTFISIILMKCGCVCLWLLVCEADILYLDDCFNFICSVVLFFEERGHTLARNLETNEEQWKSRNNLHSYRALYVVSGTDTIQGFHDLKQFVDIVIMTCCDRK